MSDYEIGKVHWSASLGGEEPGASIGVQVVEAHAGPVVQLKTTFTAGNARFVTNNFALLSGADVWLRNALGDAMSFLAGLKARRGQEKAGVKP
jgi:hypothetical protein